ncbi:cupin domain-containing protein [Propylenella binzhouense]|uniref:Cupin domain-containing protein n=1 Tax=Propylenella binzhouense TaxID=2555902 RepID=A0A964T7R3_9HYPH|nr:cupin domain-containing protein [Propylenella binzhouense]MYZ49615.1 cupin domain-containing protein [Propylenella binzhouense]
MPKIDIAATAEQNSCGYPAPFHEIARGRFRRPLGDAGGLDQFGVNLCRLEPGSASSQRHWHAREDEFVYVVDGEVVLIEDGGETVLRAGDAAAFRAGVANGHRLVNRTGRDAHFLEIGTRDPADCIEYTDIDMKCVPEGGVGRFVRRDGTPYPPR